MVCTQKRDRGEHNPPGFIKLKIIDYVYNNINGVKTPVLKEHLKVKYRVGETKGIEDISNLSKKNIT